MKNKKPNKNKSSGPVVHPKTIEYILLLVHIIIVAHSIYSEVNT